MTVAIAVSAAAGVVSFAAPCVMPLVPGCLAFASGLTSAREHDRSPGRGTVLLASVLFVLGFAVFFTLLGGAFVGLGQAIAEHRQLVGALAGLSTAGPLTGTRLRALPHQDAFWFAWAAFQPDTSVVEQ